MLPCETRVSQIISEILVLPVVTRIRASEATVSVVASIFPVETARSSVSAVIFCTRISPVLVWMRILSEADASFLTLPVVVTTSIFSKKKPTGISMSPVCSLIVSVPYDSFGRYTVIFIFSVWMPMYSYHSRLSVRVIVSAWS